MWHRRGAGTRALAPASAPLSATTRIPLAGFGRQQTSQPRGLHPDALGQPARRYRHMHRVIATEHRT
jgi:hypothetical protein